MTGLAALASLLLGVGRLRAEPTAADKALATSLFKEGKALIQGGEIARACRKFEESQRLDPGGGTLLNLAVCHEKEGRSATAWAEFVEALSLARREGRDDRVKLAREHVAALEPDLSKMLIVVPPSVDRPDLAIKRDGDLLGRPAWGAAMPVDPGEHLIEASAPGKVPWSVRVKVGVARDVNTVVLPQLKDARPRPRGLGRRTAGFVAGGVGVVWVGVGSFFGLRAFAKRRQSDKQCPGGRCSESAVALNDEAKTAADLSTASFIVGAAGLGLGTYLLLSGGESAPRAGGPRVSLSVGPRLTGVQATWAFR
jgi:hypothetical protein